MDVLKSNLQNDVNSVANKNNQRENRGKLITLSTESPDQQKQRLL